jgi:hypothetical protein
VVQQQAAVMLQVFVGEMLGLQCSRSGIMAALVVLLLGRLAAVGGMQGP